MNRDFVTKLVKLTIEGFRNIRDEVTIDFDPGINIFIGPNNAGKSNILKALLKLFEHSKITYGPDRPKPGLRVTDFDLAPEDRFNDANGTKLAKMTYLFEFEYSINDFFEIWKGDGTGAVDDLFKGGDQNEIKKIRKGKLVFEYDDNRAPKFRINDESLTNELALAYKKCTRADLSNALGLKILMDLTNADYPLLSQFEHQLRFVPDMRKITGEAKLGPGGVGAITRMHGLLNPKNKSEDVYNREVLRNLRVYIGAVLDDDPERIDFRVTEDKSVLFLETSKFNRDVEDLGSGIREIVILAIDTAGLCNALLLIEEPENHLHPGLLRKWFTNLPKLGRNNQYIITTHSNVLLDLETNKRIFRVEAPLGYSQIEPAVNISELSDILKNLGVRPSDILLSNCVIWVEGGSDRVFIKKWIELFCIRYEIEPLIEGIHYCFAPYGGSCIAHISLKQEEENKESAMNKLIKVLPLSRNIIVVMDSDLENKRGGVGAIFGNTTTKEHKERIKQECVENGVLCWITKGREIENYLPLPIIKEVYTSVRKFNRFSKLGKPTDRKKPVRAVPGSSVYAEDKLKGAEDLTGKMLDFERAFNFADKELASDLESNIRALVDRIRSYRT